MLRDTISNCRGQQIVKLILILLSY